LPVHIIWDYYEKYDYFRPFLKETKAQFIFGLKIVSNFSHTGPFRAPPGIDIKEPMEELIYYTQFLL
jgi:hypothetical protein